MDDGAPAARGQAEIQSFAARYFSIIIIVRALLCTSCSSCNCKEKERSHAEIYKDGRFLGSIHVRNAPHVHFVRGVATVMAVVAAAAVEVVVADARLSAATF